MLLGKSLSLQLERNRSALQIGGLYCQGLSGLQRGYKFDERREGNDAAHGQTRADLNFLQPHISGFYRKQPCDGKAERHDHGAGKLTRRPDIIQPELDGDDQFACLLLKLDLSDGAERFCRLRHRLTRVIIIFFAGATQASCQLP